MTFGAIFDLDGVIMDTTEFIAGSIEMYLKNNGISVDPIRRKDILGIPFARIIESIETRNKVVIDCDEAREKSREMQMDLIKNKGKATDGLPQFLSALKENNIPMIIG